MRTPPDFHSHDDVHDVEVVDEEIDDVHEENVCKPQPRVGRLGVPPPSWPRLGIPLCRLIHQDAIID